MMVSIIIPFRKPSESLWEAVYHISKLTYAERELLLIPDQSLTEEDKTFISQFGMNVSVIASGPESPAVKRDLGAMQAAGEILAFIDADAYPQEQWLEVALGHFQYATVCGVGGPQLTPPDNTFWQHVSGATFTSFLNGPIAARYTSDTNAARSVDDWPSANLLMRKTDFVAAGGFKSKYWPGEDTKLCHDLVYKLKKRIAYEPNAIVFHHRSQDLHQHLLQIGRHGLHRGFLMKRFPRNSLKFSYTVPGIFFAFVVAGGLICAVIRPLWFIYLTVWKIYLILLVLSSAEVSFKNKNIFVGLATAPYVLLSHLWCGYNVIRGYYFVDEIESKLER